MILSAVLAPLASTLATTIIGLGIWRYQLIAQRKYLIADQALAAADQAATDIHKIRRAIADARLHTERFPESIPVQPWAATSSCLQEAIPRFEEFVSTMKVVERHFGKEAGEPFHKLKGIYDKICDAQNGLYFRSAAKKLYPKLEDIRQIEDWKKTVEDQGERDPITLETDKAQRVISERLCKNLRPGIFRLFLPVWG